MNAEERGWSETMARQQILGFSGVLTLIPASALVVSGLLGLEAPDALVHPVLVLGSLAAALIANVLVVAKVDAAVHEGTFRGELTIQLTGRALNLAVVVAGVALGGAIFTYLFLENFRPR